MWPGPYGDCGSRKYLLASLDQSLAADGPRLRRHLLLPPRSTRVPLEETMGALDTAVRQGKALLRGHLLLPARPDGGGRGHPLGPRDAAAHPPAVVLDAEPLDRRRPAGCLGEAGAGCIAFSPLAQGMLTDRYLGGVPDDSRASRSDTLDAGQLDKETLARSGPSKPSPGGAVRPWPRWPWPGPNGINGSPPLWSGPAACTSSIKMWPPSTGLVSPTTSSGKSMPSWVGDDAGSRSPGVPKS